MDPSILPYEQIYIKNYNFFVDFWSCKPIFQSHDGEIWLKGADLRLPP